MVGKWHRWQVYTLYTTKFSHIWILNILYLYINVFFQDFFLYIYISWFECIICIPFKNTYIHRYIYIFTLKHILFFLQQITLNSIAHYSEWWLQSKKLNHIPNPTNNIQHIYCIVEVSVQHLPGDAWLLLCHFFWDKQKVVSSLLLQT